VKKRVNFRVVFVPKQGTEAAADGLLEGLLYECPCPHAIRSSDVEWDEVCSLCGAPWVVSADGYPLCCNAAIDEWIAAQAERQLQANKKEGG